MAKRKFNPVDQRLAAQAHKLSIVRVQAADALSFAIEGVMRAEVAAMIRFVEAQTRRGIIWTDDKIKWLTRQISDGFASAMMEGEDAYNEGLREFAEVSYDWARKMLIKGIPRWYFRNVVSTAVIGEATADRLPVSPQRFTIAERLYKKYVAPAIDVEAYAEPIADMVASGDRMSDEEWEEYAEEVIFPPLTKSEVETIVAGDQWRRTFPGGKSKFNDPGFHSRLVDGISRGENVEGLTKSIRDLENGVYWKARRTARTESLRVAEMAQRETWADLGDMMEGAQILAVLDQNTRAHHAERNGQVYSKVPGEGELPLEELPILPDEPNCRCMSTPVLTEPEIVAENPELQAVFANAGEENIPDPAAYDKWFDQADSTARKLAVGARRYNEMADRLGGSRPVEWTDFINPASGKLLSRDDLANEKDADRETRKKEVEKVLRAREAMIREIAAKGYIGKN